MLTRETQEANAEETSRGTEPQRKETRDQEEHSAMARESDQAICGEDTQGLLADAVQETQNIGSTDDEERDTQKAMGGPATDPPGQT